MSRIHIDELLEEFTKQQLYDILQYLMDEDYAICTKISLYLKEKYSRRSAFLDEAREL